MSSDPASTRPIRCTTCSQPLDSPICCTSCGELHAEPLGQCSYFELFGLPQSYDIDDKLLHRKYLSLTRSVHPDVAGRASEEKRSDALAISSEMNRAYETLRDPVQRADYLLTLADEDPSPDSRTAPPALLGEVMMVREEIEEARHANDRAAIENLRRQVAQKHKACMDSIVALCRALPDNNPQTRQALRQQLNAIKYWSNLAERLLPGGDVD